MDHIASENRNKVVIGVDDSVANLEFLKLTLVAAGYSFVGVESGSECLTLVLRVSPRLVLLDVQMPGLDGFETCRRLRALPEIRTVPIAFLTGSSKTREDVRKGMSVGGNDFIVKPFDPVQLLERVKHWVSRRVEAGHGAI